MNYIKRLGLITSVLSIAACTSAPVHYHTLVAPLMATAKPDIAAPFFIEVMPVGIPAQLDQPQLVVRQGESGIAMLDGERWASPFGDEVRDALSSNLIQRLDTQDVGGLSHPSSKPVLRIKLQIRRFDAWPGQQVQLLADWNLNLMNASKNTLLSCEGEFKQLTAGGYPELTRSEQQMIDQLASRIAEDARALTQSSTPACSAAGLVRQ